ncbi:hypothetical protein WN943_014157 [Citrus x changshan-huyou]
MELLLALPVGGGSYGQWRPLPLKWQQWSPNAHVEGSNETSLMLTEAAVVKESCRRS